MMDAQAIVALTLRATKVHHLRFDRPAHYPEVAHRIGILWEYDSQTHISGNAYFALTPCVAMGGGQLDLEHFIRMVKNVAQDARHKDEDKTPAHLLSITRGAVTPNHPTGTKTSMTEIRPSQLQFEVQARVPMLSAMVGKEPKNDTVNWHMIHM